MCAVLAPSCSSRGSLNGEALIVFRRLGNQTGEADTLSRLGDVHRSSGDYGSAREACADALVLFGRLVARNGEWSALSGLGDLDLQAGDRRKARDVYLQPLAVARELPEPSVEVN